MSTESHDRNRTDEEIRRDVVAGLAQDPRLRNTQIDTRVENGIVALTGSVDAYMKRWSADAVACRIPGVRSVVNELEVILPRSSERSDAQITAAATNALASSATLAPHTIGVAVENGIVTLTGSVEWNFLREDAERIVRDLWGVRAIRNRIAVRARSILAELKQEIRRALARTAETEGANIGIETQGGKVTMRGTACSEAQRAAAERVAWSTEGVTSVENEITLKDDET
jgi:osmotically-inducible protein OsmY